jgi:transketolase
MVGIFKKTMEKLRNKELRRMIIETSFRSGACHIGSALSCIDILVDIHKKMRKKDIFIFGKASGVAAYYCLLAKRGIIKKKKLVYYLKNFPLPSKEVPGVIVSLGSLGHGLPFAVGLALADRKKDIYLLMSDAELQEGTTWESLLFIKQHKLKNLKIYVDYNGLQATDKIANVLDLPYWFFEMNNFRIIWNFKGKGVSFLEDKVESHYLNLSESQYKQAIKELS